VGSSSANINNAIKKAQGRLIKILFQDDFLYSNTSLQEIADAFDIEKDEWLVTACEHTDDGATFIRPFYPKYNRKIHLGINTISSPSVLTIKNSCPMLFDETLLWLMDVDYYKRLYIRYGRPTILNTINVVNRNGIHQVSNSQVSEERKKKEEAYTKEKFALYTQEDVVLDTVTLVVVSTIKIPETLKALEYSMRGISYKEVLLISDKKPNNLDSRITFKQCPPIQSIDEYSKFMLYDLASYIATDHALVVQYDGYVLRPLKWDKHFLEYDYIGAPWEENAHFTTDGTNVRIGNGGFSLRSKKLLNIFNETGLPFTDNGTGFYNEDGMISNYYRKELEEQGIRYAPVPVASRFSCEVICPDSYPEPFGFHKNQNLLPLGRYIRNFITRQIKKLHL
jgi:hypothetical protein